MRTPPSIAEARDIAQDFFASLGYTIPLDLVIRERCSELYGDEFSEAMFTGGLHQASGPNEKGFVSLFTKNHSSPEALVRTLRHEVLGHYGINTHQIVQKRRLLDAIIASKEEPSLAVVWGSVEAMYSNLPPLGQAEEVFAKIAETTPTFGLSTAPESSITQQPDIGIITAADLAKESQYITKGIVDGHRSQRTFHTPDHWDENFTPTKAKSLTKEAFSRKVDTFRHTQSTSSSPSHSP